MNGKEWLPPPPRRAPKRILSLHRAVAVAIRAETKGIRKPLSDPLADFPSIETGSAQETEARLLELQADIIIRDDALNQREILLKNREREISEYGALLEAHEKVLMSRVNASSGNAANNDEVGDETAALKALRSELNAQERSLADARKMLKEREAFIEQCENELVEKSMLLTEREARIEQKEEDHQVKTRNPFEPDEDTRASA